MSTYVYGSGLSYRDYLQAKSLVSDVQVEISKQTRSLLASNEELQREHIRVTTNSVRAQTQAIAAGFERLSFELGSIREGIEELNATFEWGLSELLTSVGEVNTNLAELIKIAKSPAQTWAYEQFDIARDAYRRGLLQETIEHLDRAINGHASNSGYKLEFRFHYLLGTVRLGSFANNSPEIFHLPAAETAFLAAAKYAKTDHPQESGRAYLAAGWSAYCQGKIDKARELTELATVTFHELPEAHFQLAKIYMHMDNTRLALQCLKDAIQLDRRYVLKAPADGDFRRHRAKVESGV